MAKVKNKKKPAQTQQISVPASPVSSAKSVEKYVPAALIILFVIFYYKILSGQAFLWEDITEQTFPNLTFTLHSIKNGWFPFWTPYIFSGMPFFADVLTSLFYPPQWVLFFVSLFTNTHSVLLNTFVVLHTLIFGVGFYFLSRHFSMRRLAALFVATGVLFTGYISLHIIHNTYLYVISWLPLILLFLDKAYRTNTLRPLLIAAILYGISTTGGHPQTSMHLTYVFFGWTIFTMVINRKLPRRSLISYFIYFCIFVGLGLSLALIQFFPSIELMKESMREVMTFENSSLGSIPFSRLLTFISPKFFGYISDNAARAVYWAYPGQTFLFWETNAFVGITTLLLAVRAFFVGRKNPVIIFFSILAGLALLLALGKNTPFYYLVYSIIPGFKNFRLPGRFTSWLSFSLVILAGFGLDSLLKSKTSEKNYFKAIASIASFIALGALLFLSGVFDTLSEFFQHESILKYSRNAMSITLVVTIASTTLISVLLFTSYKKSAAFLLVILVFIELLSFGQPFGNAPRSFESYYLGADLSDLKKQLKEKPFRIQSRLYRGANKGEMLLPRNLGNVAYIPLTEGYNQFILQRYSALLNDINDTVSQQLLNIRYKKVPGENAFHQINAVPRFYCSPFVQVFDNKEEVRDFMNSGQFIPGKTIAVEKQLPFALDTAHGHKASIKILKENPNRIELEVKTEGNTMLNASEIYYSAWVASVDDKPVDIYASNYAFRGVPINKGTHRVVMQYRSSYFLFGSLITVSALFIILLLLFNTKAYSLTQGLITGQKNKIA